MGNDTVMGNMGLQLRLQGMNLEDRKDKLSSLSWKVWKLALDPARKGPQPPGPQRSLEW